MSSSAMTVRRGLTARQSSANTVSLTWRNVSTARKCSKPQEKSKLTSRLSTRRNVGLKAASTSSIRQKLCLTTPKNTIISPAVNVPLSWSLWRVWPNTPSYCTPSSVTTTTAPMWRTRRRSWRVTRSWSTSGARSVRTSSPGQTLLNTNVSTLLTMCLHSLTEFSCRTFTSNTSRTISYD